MNQKQIIMVIGHHWSGLVKHLESGSRRVLAWGAQTVFKSKYWLSQDVRELAQKISRSAKNSRSLKQAFKDINAWAWWFRSLVLSITFLLVFSIATSQMWNVSISKLDSLNEESKLKKALYKRMAYESGLLDQRQERINTIELRFGEMLEMIPVQLEIVHVLDQISIVARDSGMQLQSFKPEPEIMESSYAVLPISIRLTGSFESVGRFLEAVSRMKHLITIDVLLESSESMQGRLNLIAKLKAYRGEPTAVSQETTKNLRNTDAVR